MLSNSDVGAVLAALRAAGVRAEVAGDKVRLSPAGKIPAELLPVLRQHKQEIIAALRGPAEWQEARELTARLQADRERLRQLLREAGRRRGWPRVQLTEWLTLLPGPASWERYLSCPAHGPDEYRRLLAALGG